MKNKKQANWEVEFDKKFVSLYGKKVEGFSIKDVKFLLKRLKKYGL